ncbi:MAG: chorismate mutase [Bacteroidetes bacterium]|nr:chorismate mutase [Bacteroidota bacterium]
MNTLDNYRHQIDALDAALIRTLGERFELCRKIAEFKKEAFVPMMQPGRVEEVKRRCARLGAEHGVNPQLVVEMYTLIIGESCRVEDEIIGTPEKQQAA